MAVRRNRRFPLHHAGSKGSGFRVYFGFHQVADGFHDFEVWGLEVYILEGLTG